MSARLLWIDLCSQSSGCGLFESIRDQYETVRIELFERATNAIHQFAPQLTCLEFDYPDEIRLRAIPTLRQVFTKLPLLMLTEFHSESLAVWAFRNGVFDYRVKPITLHTLTRSIDILVSNEKYLRHGYRCNNRLPADLIGPAGHLQSPPLPARRTMVAVAYIAEHFDHDLKRDVLASLCHLSPSDFSRVFREEQGVTFERFLLQYRLAKARERLAEPHMTISRAAYSAGFRDVSYFSRAFRLLSGMTPSDYQRRAGPQVA